MSLGLVPEAVFGCETSYLSIYINDVWDETVIRGTWGFYHRITSLHGLFAIAFEIQREIYRKEMSTGPNTGPVDRLICGKKYCHGSEVNTPTVTLCTITSIVETS